MKKWTLFLLVLISGQFSWATCSSLTDNNPMPFPFNVGIIQKYEKNWLFTQNRELSLRINRTTPDHYNYYMFNYITDKKSHGQLERNNNQLCDLNNSTPFCLYNNNDALRIRLSTHKECIDSSLSVLSFTR